MIRTHCLAAITLACAAGGALADGETFEFRVSNVISPEQPVATVELWARFDPRDYAFNSGLFDVRAAEVGWSELRVRLAGPPGQRPGAVHGTDVIGVLVGQAHFCPTVCADPDNPILLWDAVFTAEDFTPRSVELTTRTLVFRVNPWAHAATTESRMTTFVEGAGEIIIVPAPAGLVSIAGAAALASLRRRR